MSLLNWLFGEAKSEARPADEFKPNFDASKFISDKPCGHALLDAEAQKLLARSKEKTRVTPFFPFPTGSKE